MDNFRNSESGPSSTNQFGSAEPKQDIRIGEMLFQYRDYTPIPLIILMLFVSKPSPLTALIGTLILLFGELIRIVSVSHIGSISRTRKNQTGAELVTSGPYGMVRNPLYVGNFFMVLGIVVFSGVLWLALLTLILFAVQYHFIVSYEEDLLAQRFPETFSEYCTAVPRWIPSDWRKLGDIDISRSGLMPALRSERRTMTAGFAILLVLALLSHSLIPKS